MMKRLLILACVVHAGINAAQAAPCESLSTLAIANATIVAAAIQAAGTFSPPLPAGVAATPANSAFANLPAFCRVIASLTPSADSDIRIEVWMPSMNWNGKLQSVGNGAWAGTIGYSALAQALAGGCGGKVDRTRPLCPYPQVARYSGKGSTDDAENFVCRMP